MEQSRQTVITKAASLLVVLATMPAMVLAASAPALAQSAVGVAAGVLEKPEATPYQYGTHAITDEASGARYALQSESVNLDAYVGERVTVYGTPVPGYQDGQVEGGPDLLRVDRVVPADGPPSERLATLSFELAVECEPPAGAAFFGNVRTGEGGPGIFAQLLDPDGDGLYTGVATLPDRFGPGPSPVPPGVEPVALPVSMVQGTGTRSTGSGTFPGEPTSVIKDFGVVPMEAENTFSAGVSFCGDGGGTSGGGAMALPATGGALPVAGLLGVLLVGGGLLARRIARR